MHRHNRVQRIGLAIQHGPRFQLLVKGAERLDIAFQVGQHLFAFARQFEIRLDVARAAHQFLIVRDQFFQAFAFAHQRLARRRIVPQRRIGQLVLNVG